MAANAARFERLLQQPMKRYGEELYLQWLQEASMPRYEYECPACELRLELTHSITDETPRLCRVCGYRMQRVIQTVATHFRGPGFASTDK